MNTNWIGDMLFRNGLPKQVIERNTEEYKLRLDHEEDERRN
jgi:hypothetical protein